MQLIYLYIENFMCYDSTELNLSSINSAIIVGKIDGNDLYSNGVGKTTIFKAIEYVLFNQSREINLEKIIRDDAAASKVILDFTINDKIYRIVRARTRKGSADLSLFERNAVESDNAHTVETDPDLWEDKTSRRTPDTEADIAKIIKINYKAFISTVHFLQNDFTGLATATPEKRKQILKESLQLLIYTKLEKIAKDRAGLLSKDIEKNRTLLSSLNDPMKDMAEIKEKILDNKQATTQQEEKIKCVEEEMVKEKNQLEEFINQYSILDNQSATIYQKRKSLLEEIKNLGPIITEYTGKKKIILEEAKILSNSLTALQENKTKLQAIDFTASDTIKSEMIKIRDTIASTQAEIKTISSILDELKIPIPADGKCKHCRQILSQEHRKICQDEINKQVINKEQLLTKMRNDLPKLFSTENTLQHKLTTLEEEKRQLEGISNQISSKQKEIENKKTLFQEYKDLLDQHQNQLTEKTAAVQEAEEELERANGREIKALKSQIEHQKNTINNVKINMASLTKELNILNSHAAVLDHSLIEKEKDLTKKQTLENDTLKLEKKFSIYPDVIQAFGSKGIPNLIIQNILDDLQVEANNLLMQLRPGLQLTFSIEKTNTEGELDDDLEINYYLNGKPRDYGQLSGAMKLIVMFSLKLGLSFLLHKMMGVNIQFLLLDEIDQSLDKAGVDAFADIIKFFQNNFTILIITHNDRLKDKFNQAILVEQDQNAISKARMVSSW